MNQRILAGFSLALAFAASASPAAGARKGGSSVLLPSAAIQWNDVPGFPGVKLAVLEGDPGKGAHHSMMKFTPGFAAPLHHHSSDHFVTVVSGTLILTVDGKEVSLPAGSFFQFKGKKPHLTKSGPDAECILSVDCRGKWDVVPEAGGKK